MSFLVFPTQHTNQHNEALPDGPGKMCMGEYNCFSLGCIPNHNIKVFYIANLKILPNLADLSPTYCGYSVGLLSKHKSKVVLKVIKCNAAKYNVTKNRRTFSFQMILN